MLELEGQPAAGQGVATDIIEAAGRAYVRALALAVAKAARGEQPKPKPEDCPSRCPRRRAESAHRRWRSLATYRRT